MASLSTDNGGLRRIQFKAADGKRKALRLGRIPLNRAQTILAHVCHLEACLVDGSAAPPQTAAWLASIGDTLRARLAELGLAAPKADPRAATAPTGGELIAAYKARSHWEGHKRKTKLNKGRAFHYLAWHFGNDRPIDSITKADAIDFYARLRLTTEAMGAGLAHATANSMASMVFTLFNYAIDAELIIRNPFKSLPRTARKGNNCHVTLSESLAVLEKMQGTEQRLLFGLARWGGLRVPSEPALLRWCDVDWARDRFLVHAPKTERHEGREKRWVPIFPELKALFQERWDEAIEGEVFVLPSVARGNDSVPTTWMKSAFRRAEVSWPRMFHSMRATRETELSEQFPMHTVCAWIGNSQAVATKHYLQVLESHFEQAAQNAAQQAATPSGNTGKASGAKRQSNRSSAR